MSSPRPPVPPLQLIPLALIALALGACDAGPSTALDPLAASIERGAFDVDPATGLAHLREPALGGAARALHLEDVRWGRLVDVWALDPATGEPVLTVPGFVADPLELGQPAELELASSLTGRERLTVLHPVGSAALAATLARLERGLVTLAERGLDPAGLPLDEVPRNAALVLRFNDLLDPNSVGAHSVELTLGEAPATQAVASPALSHGALVDGKLVSSRLVVELAPALVPAPAASVALCLALEGSSAVRSLGGRPLTPGADDRLQASSHALWRARAFRTGGHGDGLLLDTERPYVVGSLPGQVTAVVPTAAPGLFVIDFTFSWQACALAPQAGDVVLLAAHTLELLADAGQPVAGATGRLRAQLVAGDPMTLAPGAGLLRTRWTAATTARPECFVRIVPMPAVPPGAGASTASIVELDFSEAMDPASVAALSTFRLAYGQPPDPSPLAEHVVGDVVAQAGLASFAFQPSQPLRHQQGSAELYRVRLAGGLDGVRDLAGNPLGFDLPETSFVLEPTQPTQDTGSLALTFESVDEDGDGLPELRGQMLYDLPAGRITGRPVTRFAAVVDGSQPLIGAMIPYASPLQTPLNPLGAKAMLSWRYIDLGFGLLDDASHNLDVEGLSWAPFGATVVMDQFGEFRMALAHAGFLPDEVVNFGLLPIWKDSGFKPIYADNLLSPSEDPLTVVHAKSKGYVVDPADAFLATTGTVMMPWPLNRNVPPSQFVTWTWRDTAILAVGAPLGAGADPQRVGQILGTPATTGFYPADLVPTIGLPMLTEYRCYPDSGAFGLNGFSTSFALNSSYKPTFRAYSAGGVGPAGTKLVDPDAEPVATGGVNPSTGGPTLPIDNSVYHGQADFVVRISRAHTRWLDTGAAHQFAAVVAEGQVVPGSTQVLLAFRGASSITSAAGGTPWVDAGNLDPYGDGYTSSQLFALQKPIGNAYDVVYHPTVGDKSWDADLTSLDGARYVQARVSFVADPVSLDVPTLTGLGIAFVK